MRTQHRIMLCLLFAVILIGCGGGKNVQPTRSLKVDANGWSQNGKGYLQIQVNLIGYEKEDLPASPDFRIWVEENDKWPREDEGYEPWHSYYDDNFVSQSAVGNKARWIEMGSEKNGGFTYELAPFILIDDWANAKECPFDPITIEVKEGLADGEYMIDSSLCKSMFVNAKNDSAEDRDESTPEKETVKVENKDDFCKPLRKPAILQSEVFGDDFLCGNIYLHEKQKGNVRGAVVLGRFEAKGQNAIGVNCLQADNLDTGELGKASCGSGNARNGGGTNGSMRTTYIPESTSGDNIRITWWIFSAHANSEYLEPETDPVDQKNRTFLEGQRWNTSGFKPIIFTQEVASLKKYQVMMKFP